MIPPEVLAAARAAHAKFYPRGPFVSITLAQWAIESAWGKDASGKNNYFGIKATPTQVAFGQASLRWTHETWDGKYTKTAQYFANYATLEDCFVAHAALLVTPHYVDCQRAATPDDYAHALREDGYATGEPGLAYDVALINLMKESNLYQYDEPSAPPATKGNAMNFLSVLTTLLTNIPAELQVVQTGVSDIQALAQNPAVAEFAGLLESLFHISAPTAGSAVVIEPKTTMSAVKR